MSLTCLMPRETRRFSGSIFSTLAVIGSPLRKTSCGFFTRPVQLTSPTCTKPSTPSSISINAPNSPILPTLPLTTLPPAHSSPLPHNVHALHPIRLHRRMRHASSNTPRRVLQARHSPQLDHPAVPGRLLHLPVPHLLFLQRHHQPSPLALPPFFQNRPPANPHIPPAS